MKHLPNNLKEYRKKWNLKQSDVARMLGLASTDRISAWENGTSYPSVENLAKLCLIYGACIHDLYPALFQKLIDRSEPYSVVSPLQEK